MYTTMTRKELINMIADALDERAEMGSSGREDWSIFDTGFRVETWSDVPVTVTDASTGEFFTITVSKSKNLDKRFSK